MAQVKLERQSDELNRRNSAFDNKLRPTQFGDFVGQEKIRDRLMLAVEAAKSLTMCSFQVRPGSARPRFPIY